MLQLLQLLLIRPPYRGEEFRIGPTCFDAWVARGPIRAEENTG